ncbi:EamA family transporter [Alkalicaulis satelles]|uniref:EamA family transporter n=1 Tax=Alkalicaulis satelles TaxID=2609175 RepID=A0A5M6ZMY4_9PROT|nr:EamA family transporter [Alkalicaulis satelles]KAA5803651.1 EamA family transporter [Alkalicaulis satelles]
MSEAPVIALAAALGSAMAHAVMTLFTKQARDMLVFRAVSMTICALALSPLLILLPFPPWEAWRFLLLGAAIIWAFNMAMIAAMQRGQMNLVYPVMRGSAPALAGLFAFIVLGEPLGPAAILGLSIASAALIAFAWPERGGAPKAGALAFALTAALMTASYTVNDASGVRAAGSALSYLSWFFVLSAASLGATALIRRGRAFAMQARSELPRAAASSVFNITTYGLALYALSIAPVAPVAALRETSIVFGAILAAIVLKEPFGARRAVMALVLAGGLALLQLG